MAKFSLIFLSLLLYYLHYLQNVLLHSEIFTFLHSLLYEQQWNVIVFVELLEILMLLV